MLFFLFKKKTAYEMRISDWSSDVCSSDLRAARRRPCRDAARGGRTRRRGGGCGGQRRDRRHGGDIPQLSARPFGAGADEGGRRPRGPGSAPRRRAGGDGGPPCELNGRCWRTSRAVRHFWARESSEERRVGNERVSAGSSWWSPYL